MKIKERVNQEIARDHHHEMRKSIRRHQAYFRQTFCIEPTCVSIGEFGTIVKANGFKFKFWFAAFGRRWYYLIANCQQCGKTVRKGLPFARLKGMRQALKKSDEHTALCLICTLPLLGKLRKHPKVHGFLELVTFGGRYWPFGIVTTEEKRITERVEKLKEALVGLSIRDICYSHENRYRIILDNDFKLECSIHDLAREMLAKNYRGPRGGWV